MQKTAGIPMHSSGGVCVAYGVAGRSGAERMLLVCMLVMGSIDLHRRA